MGDRFVVGFRARPGATPLYLYSHWGGDEQGNTVSDALAATRSRWSDPDYATRIAVSAIVGDDWAKETGYGLSTDGFASPDYPTMFMVDWETQTVEKLSIEDEANPSMRLIGGWSFDNFIGLHDDKKIINIIR
jgi:hypothetical protein